MSWASRSYTFAREDLDRRAAFSSWVQAFEAFYPGVTDDVEAACQQTTEFLGGSWTPTLSEALIGGTRFKMLQWPPAIANGVLTLRVRVYRQNGETADFTFNRRFNTFSSETVSDDVL
jgi:hypothetical protein